MVNVKESVGADSEGTNNKRGADLRLALFILRRTGLWNPSGCVIWMYHAYTAFIIITVIMGIITLCVASILHVDNTPVFSHIVCLLLQCIAACLKSLDFLRQRKRIRRLVQRINELPQPPAGSEEEKTIRRFALEGNAVGMFYTMLGGITYIIWHIQPLVVGNRAASAACEHEKQIAMGITSPHNKTDDNDECNIHLLPTEAWYPIDTNKLIPYTVAYVHQLEWVFYVYINTNTIDCLWVSLMLHLAAQTRCLAAKMRTMRTKHDLKTCVQYHQHLGECVKGLQAVMGPSALIQFLASLGVICLALFTMTQVSDGVRKSQFVAFLVTMSEEVLLFCWYGEAVSSSSKDLAAAVYDAPWLQADVALRKEMQFVLTRSQKPFILRTAGGFNELSRRTFLSLIQASYSFYTVLISMED